MDHDSKLSGPDEFKPTRRLFRLAHFLRLDVWGTSRMSCAAEADMCAAAVLLTVIFLFDAATWSLLFYFILNAGSLELDLVRLFFALVMGIFPAVVLLMYERGFMTADTKTHGWRHLVRPTAIRLVVVAMAACITAQPLEIIAFGRPIEKRIAEEKTHKYVLSRYKELEEQKARREKASRLLGDELGDAGNQQNGGETNLKHANMRLAATQEELSENQASKNKVEAELEGLRVQQRSAQQALTTDRAHLQGTEAALKRAPDDAALSQERQQESSTVEEDQNRWVRLNAEIENLRSRLQELNLDIDDKAKAEEAQEKEQLSAEHQADAHAKVQQIRNDIQGAIEGQRIPDDDDDPDGADFSPTYTWLDQLRIINDLRLGRPARWPGAPKETIQTLMLEFPQLNNETQDDADADKHNANRTYWAIFSVAMIIPIMSLLFKMIMPSHLSYYYSSKFQSLSGHPDAEALERVVYLMEQGPRAVNARGGGPTGVNGNDGSLEQRPRGTSTGTASPMSAAGNGNFEEVGVTSDQRTGSDGHNRRNGSQY